MTYFSSVPGFTEIRCVLYISFLVYSRKNYLNRLPPEGQCDIQREVTDFTSQILPNCLGNHPLEVKAGFKYVGSATPGKVLI